MKKTITIVFMLVLMFTISPKVVQASWWNPISWFQRSARVSTPVSVPVSTSSSPVSPEVKSNPEAKKDKNNITVKLGQVVELFGVKAKIIDVVEDSRCAKGNECIVAGTVRVNVLASFGPISKTVTLTLGQPYTVSGHTITFVSVTPDKAVGVKINLQDYVFSFSLVNPKGDLNFDKDNNFSGSQENQKKQIEDKSIIKPADLSMFRTQGEMYKQDVGSYAGFCQSKDVTKIQSGLVCNDSATSWAVSAKVSSIGFMCVDSAGVLKNTSTQLTQGQIACPTN